MIFEPWKCSPWRHSSSLEINSAVQTTLEETRDGKILRGISTQSENPVSPLPMSLYVVFVRRIMSSASSKCDNIHSQKLALGKGRMLIACLTSFCNGKKTAPLSMDYSQCSKTSRESNCPQAYSYSTIPTSTLCHVREARRKEGAQHTTGKHYGRRIVRFPKPTRRRWQLPQVHLCRRMDGRCNAKVTTAWRDKECTSIALLNFQVINDGPNN